MIPAAFAYARPTDLADALEQLAAGGGGAKVLAGGQSLIPLLRLRLASAEKHNRTVPSQKARNIKLS